MMIQEFEAAASSKEFGINDLLFMYDDYHWMVIECVKIAASQHTLPFCVVCVLAALMLQNLFKSTMVFPGNQIGTGMQVGMHFFVTGTPAIGKNTSFALLKMIQDRTKKLNNEFIMKYNLYYKSIWFDYLFTASRLKIAFSQSYQRLGQGIIFYIEGSFELSQVAKAGPEDTIQLITQLGDDFFPGQFCSNSSHNANTMIELRTSIFATGTTHLFVFISNYSDRGATSRGVCVYLFETNTYDELIAQMKEEDFEDVDQIDVSQMRRVLEVDPLNVQNYNNNKN